ncbi:hypothetical protein NKI19_32430, partial [Mesorhizobium sp. M0751]|uniref:hypothetical protein n=1 Tax=Mesorhizobium sp. M0751 TaxID=2956992 RepID=UPI00333B3AD0
LSALATLTVTNMTNRNKNVETRQCQIPANLFSTDGAVLKPEARPRDKLCSAELVAFVHFNDQKG